MSSRATDAPNLILHNGRFTTLDKRKPTAEAVAIGDGVFTAVGSNVEILVLAGDATQVIDLNGRSVLPGLIDNHLHIIRGGLNFNMELRWDGVRSLATAMEMLRRQVAITPPPQWVRVVGGFTEHQFVEKRLPTIHRPGRRRVPAHGARRAARCRDSARVLRAIESAAREALGRGRR
jgi:predicted amidohydrolase YtcJ